MLHANFNTYNNYVTDSLYQWDKNQDLIIEGLNLSVAPEVHFSNARMDKAIVKQATLSGGIITVRIPNSLLQESLIIKAYIGIYRDDAFNIIESVEIPIIARERPSDYSFTTDEEEIYSFNALEYKVGAVLDLVKTSVSPIWDTLCDEPDGHIPGIPIPVDTDKYVSYIATIKNGDITVDIPLYSSSFITTSSKQYSFVGEGVFNAIDGIYAQIKIECHITDNHFYVDNLSWESDSMSDNSALVKLVGVSKEPAEYISIKHTYDPESEEAISGKGVAQALSQFEIPEFPENNNTGSGVSEAQRQTLLAVINAIGLFNVDNAQVLLDNFNKAWDIVEPVPATSIALNKTELTFTSEDTQTITATVLPLNTTDVVVWKSSNTSVATVLNGVVTPLINGETTIIATAGDKSATCKVTVNLDGYIENPLYLKKGYLGNASTVTSEPVSHDTYVNAISLDAVPVSNGSIYKLTSTQSDSVNKNFGNFLFYNENGVFVKYLYSNAIPDTTFTTVKADANGYIRYTARYHNQVTLNPGLPVTKVTVTTGDESIEYTVVERE